MPTDPIIDEIHAVREALAEAAGYDADRVAEAARKRERESGRTAVTLPPRPVTILKKNAS